MPPSANPLRLWVDAQLPPALARWLAQQSAVSVATHVEALGHLRTPDSALFDAARSAGAIVVTKDLDFVQLLERRGPPPQVVWLTCGNVSNRALHAMLAEAWPRVAELLHAGEALVEIRGSRLGAG